MSQKYVYVFGGRETEGNGKMKDLLGGKGANLAEMAKLGIPVPPGFTISTEVCALYDQQSNRFPAGLKKQVQEGVRHTERQMKTTFGDPSNPLLLSVRSGARVSMPGMMDTVLNIGMNDETVRGFISKTSDPRAGYDSYRRFVQMYGDVVLGVSGDLFEALIEAFKRDREVDKDTDLTAEDLQALVEEFKEVIEEEGYSFPEEPWDQLWGAIGAVFRSWNTPRAISYRQLNGIPDDWGTAVNVQAMVFGNMGQDSATGVAFTRDPATGENRFYGEYLLNAQGEDVVAGVRTPQPLNRAQKRDAKLPSLEEEMPGIYKQLLKIRDHLEKHYADVQDIEFTVQRGKLWMLQTRTGKRTAAAAIKIGVDMVKEGLIDRETAILRVQPEQIDQLLHPMIDSKAKVQVLATGLPASPGAASGRVVFSADEAVRESEKGRQVILVRVETSPEDVHGMAAAKGILTARGGMTSHAAVVARGMGKSCVAGCGDIQIDYDAGTFRAGDVVVKRGDWITLDGAKGEVILGQAATVQPKLVGDFKTLMVWADQVRELGVLANADRPQDAQLAREFGAEGIGLARTEHMFFAEDRLPWVQKLILAEAQEERLEAVEHLLPMQREDFKGLLLAMDGLPVIIRLLDPPLHEFLPKYEDLVVELTELRCQLGQASAASKKARLEKQLAEKEKLLAKLEKLREVNPMLGHRGCRLGVTFPEIYQMQARAIFEAAAALVAEGKSPKPEVMIPLVGHVNELKLTREIVEKAAQEAMERMGTQLSCIIGTMIELPRAALTADEIAQAAQFFSFGTNDLTQMTFGFSRDDIEGKFLFYYLKKRILEKNPFAALDRRGVGQLVTMGIELGRKTRPDLEVGICGEHGGDPSSIAFFHQAGMNYVSCSPYRVPIARLAAAHAAIRQKHDSEDGGARGQR